MAAELYLLRHAAFQADRAFRDLRNRQRGKYMQDLEAKRLRESLVEYENYLNEIRQVTRKNVEALDVIQKYTDQSAAGMQNLAEQSIEGIQRVTTESG